MDIQQISDHLEITAVLHRYCRAVDSQDWDLYRTVFTEDARIDYTTAPTGAAGTREEIVEWLRTNLALFSMTQHYVTNLEIDLDGDAATVRAMLYNPLQFAGVEQPIFCGGNYHHQMVRTPEGWRSRNLREEMLWFSNSLVTDKA